MFILNVLSTIVWWRIHLYVL